MWSIKGALRCHFSQSASKALVPKKFLFKYFYGITTYTILRHALLNLISMDVIRFFLCFAAIFILAFSNFVTCSSSFHWF